MHGPRIQVAERNSNLFLRVRPSSFASILHTIPFLFLQFLCGFMLVFGRHKRMILSTFRCPQHIHNPLLTLHSGSSFPDTIQNGLPTPQTPIHHHPSDRLRDVPCQIEGIPLSPPPRFSSRKPFFPSIPHLDVRLFHESSCMAHLARPPLEHFWLLFFFFILFGLVLREKFERIRWADFRFYMR